MLQLATGFGLGHLPKAPGTWGTLAGIPVVWLLSQAGPMAYIVGSLALTVGAVIVAEWYEAHGGAHDPREVVIDEIAGYVVAMALIPFTWQGVLSSFVLFRLLDSIKPFPISVVDKKIKGGLGCVADDILAGMIANVILQTIYQQTTLLGPLP